MEALACLATLAIWIMVCVVVCSVINIFMPDEEDEEE